MGLRLRLWTVLVSVLLVPLLLAGLVTVWVVDRSRSEQVTERLATTARSVDAAMSTECARLQSLSAALAARAALAGGAADLGAVLQDTLGEGVAYAAVITGSNTVQALGAAPADPLTLHSCRSRFTAPVVAGVSPLLSASAVGTRDSNRAGTARAVAANDVDGVWLQQSLQDVGSPGVVVLAVNGSAVASSLGTRAETSALVTRLAGQASGTGTHRIGSRLVYVESAEPGSRVTTVVAEPAPGRLGLLLLTLLVVLAVGLATAVLVQVAVSGFVRPLISLTEASERVVAGDLDTSVLVASDDEVGRLSRSFNQMTAEMRQYLGALERSRDELRDNLERLGDALGSTHDLDGLVQVVLESAVAAVDARAGVAYVAESPGVLTLAAAQGLEDLDQHIARRLSFGSGVLGRLAVTGEVVRARLGTRPGELTPGPEDPLGEVLAVPLRGGNRVTGVLVLLDRLDGTRFGQVEEEEIRALAQQAGIAVDNVLLHRETERLAITDPLTGLWNFRYLSLSLAREIERASRFDRSLAVLMLDIDHFKAINDTHGHAAGDEVLREFAARVGEQTRDVDIVARYGGEEFVLVLPETVMEGAVQLGERIRVAIAERPFAAPEGAQALQVTVSVGIAAFPEHGTSPAVLLRGADTALYAAKRGGRNKVVAAQRAAEPETDAAMGAHESAPDQMAGWEPS